MTAAAAVLMMSALCASLPRPPTPTPSDPSAAFDEAALIEEDALLSPPPADPAAAEDEDVNLDAEVAQLDAPGPQPAPQPADISAVLPPAPSPSKATKSKVDESVEPRKRSERIAKKRERELERKQQEEERRERCRHNIETRDRIRKEQQERRRFLCPMAVEIQLEQVVVPEAAPEDTPLAADPAADFNDKAAANQHGGDVQLDAPGPQPAVAAPHDVAENFPLVPLAPSPSKAKKQKRSEQVALKRERELERKQQEDERRQRCRRSIETRDRIREERKALKEREQQELCRLLCPIGVQIQLERLVVPEAAPEDALLAPLPADPEDIPSIWMQYQLVPQTVVGTRRSPRDLTKTNAKIAYCKRGWPHTW
jgi:hypothetical protein